MTVRFISRIGRSRRGGGRAKALGGATLLTLLLGAVALGGCGRNASVTFELQFPTEEAFLSSSAARIRLFDAEQDIEICRKLQAGQSAETEPLVELEYRDVCEYYDGVVLDDQSQGVRALFVQVTGREDTVILQGCRLFNLAYSGDQVIVDLTVTPAFGTDRLETSCPSAAERCGGGC